MEVGNPEEVRSGAEDPGTKGSGAWGITVSLARDF